MYTIPWNPIDDVVCTVIHKQSVVMPCAFPYWGEKSKKTIINDRARIVEKAVQKNQEKKNAIAEKITLQKRKAKTRRDKQRREKFKAAKRLKFKFEGESLDPNELFDAKGNIQMISSVQHSRNEVNNQPEIENLAMETISYESYRRDADVNSDDSVDSTDNNRNKQHSC